jgi:hypothetical protein
LQTPQNSGKNHHESSKQSVAPAFAGAHRNYFEQPEIGGRSEVDKRIGKRNNTNNLVVFLPSTNTIYQELKMTRNDYLKKFASFPDVVTLNEFCAMLGGIGECTARKLLQKNRVEHFYIRCTYYIPKEKVVDYLLSDHYMKYRFKLKHGIK